MTEALTARPAVLPSYDEALSVARELGGGLAESSNLQRIWRDTNAAAAHHGLTWDWQADQWTRASFDLPAQESTPYRSGCGGLRAAACGFPE